jgi:hypothetical protein
LEALEASSEASRVVQPVSFDLFNKCSTIIWSDQSPILCRGCRNFLAAANQRLLEAVLALKSLSQLALTSCTLKIVAGIRTIRDFCVSLMANCALKVIYLFLLLAVCSDTLSVLMEKNIKNILCQKCFMSNSNR